MILWLSRVDGRVKREVLDTHEGPVCSFTGYDPDISLDTELLVKEPYAELYGHYVDAQIALENIQQEEYSCHAILFEQAWSEFRNDYNRNHLHKRVGFKY